MALRLYAGRSGCSSVTCRHGFWESARSCASRKGWQVSIVIDLMEVDAALPVRPGRHPSPGLHRVRAQRWDLKAGSLSWDGGPHGAADPAAVLRSSGNVQS